MNLPPTSPQTHSRRRLLITVAIGLSVVAVIWLLLIVWTGPNYAQDEVNAIGRLMPSAQKQCGNGDGGFGPDNREPWYTAYYTFKSSQADALNDIKKATTERGYHLQQTDSSDSSNSKLFIDTSVLDHHQQLQYGNVLLEVRFYTTPFSPTCNDGPNTSVFLNPSDQTTVSIELKLPKRK